MNQGAHITLDNGLQALAFLCERPQRLGRRIDLIIDTSDSTWVDGKGLAPAADAALAQVIDALEDGDSLSVWRLGDDERRSEPIVLSGVNAAELRQRVRELATPWRGGSFLAPTLKRLLASSIDPDAIVMLTDGALFDDPDDILDLLHNRACAWLDISDHTPPPAHESAIETLAPLRIEGKAAALRAFLPSVGTTTRLDVAGWDTAFGIRYDNAGNLVDRCAEPWLSPPRQDLRLVLLGAPDAAGNGLRANVGDDRVPVDIGAPDRVFDPVRVVLSRAFGMPWYRPALDALLAICEGDASVTLDCPHCSSTGQPRQSDDLYCNKCRRLLITTQPIAASEISPFWTGVCFPLHPERGNAVATAPTPSAGAAGSAAFERCTRQGQPCLRVSFKTVLF